MVSDRPTERDFNRQHYRCHERNVDVPTALEARNCHRHRPSWCERFGVLLLDSAGSANNDVYDDYDGCAYTDHVYDDYDGGTTDDASHNHDDRGTDYDSYNNCDDFFNDDDAKAAIIADVASFADTRASLPRVVLTQTR